MEPAHLFRAHQVLETEDIASDFIENEIGRHDWMSNWPTYKAKQPNLRGRIATWLSNAGYVAEPEEIERKIDQLILTRPGRWR